MIFFSFLSLIAPILIGFFLVHAVLEKRPGFGDILLTGSLAAGIGIGVSSCLYFLWLSLVGHSSRGYIVAEYTFIIILALWFLRALKSKEHPSSPGRQPDPGGSSSVSWILGITFLCLAMAAVVSFVVLSLNRPHGGWDAWAFWNTRARFLFKGGGHWTDAFSPLLFEIHPDYPLLLPGIVARSWTYINREDTIVPIIIAFIFTFATPSLLVSVLSLERGRYQGFIAGMVLLGTSSFVRHGSSQYADVPFGFYVLATVTMLYLQQRSPKETGLSLLAGLAAGFACWTKNEGLLFLGAVTISLALFAAFSRDRKTTVRRSLNFVLGLLPAISVLLYFKLRLAPPSDMVSEFDFHQAGGKLIDAGRYLQVSQAWLSEFVYRFPLPLLIAYAVCSGIKKQENDYKNIVNIFILLALVITAYYFIYILTPKDLTWHLDTSLNRLLAQLWPSFLFTYFLTVSPPGQAARIKRKVSLRRRP